LFSRVGQERSGESQRNIKTLIIFKRTRSTKNARPIANKSRETLFDFLAPPEQFANKIKLMKFYEFLMSKNSYDPFFVGTAARASCHDFEWLGSFLPLPVIQPEDPF
jgi:hypothetical protein